VLVLAATIAIPAAHAQEITKPEVSRTEDAAKSALPVPVDPDKYQIGPEDQLFVRVWREPDFTLPVAVRPDGKITLPLIGEVQAAGQSPLQLTATLQHMLLAYLNNPDVSVFVTEVRSKKFFIDGEVYRPGSFALVTPTSVLEALSRGGGFREFANTKRIRVLRGGEIRHFNYKEVTNGKHLEQNIAVENGDHIIVP
jgi:polysaccharide export outer membrane protein